MTKERAKTTATILGTLGILFSMAMAFKILPFKYAIFASGACFILAAAVRGLGRDQD